MLPKLCSIPECGNKFYCKTFCRMHYRRLREYGNPYTSRAQIKADCKAADCEGKQHAHGYCTTRTGTAPRTSTTFRRMATRLLWGRADSPGASA